MPHAGKRYDIRQRTLRRNVSEKIQVPEIFVYTGFCKTRYVILCVELGIPVVRHIIETVSGKSFQLCRIRAGNAERTVKRIVSAEVDETDFIGQAFINLQRFTHGRELIFFGFVPDVKSAHSPAAAEIFQRRAHRCNVCLRPDCEIIQPKNSLIENYQVDSPLFACSNEFGKKIAANIVPLFEIGRKSQRNTEFQPFVGKAFRGRVIFIRRHVVP